MKVVIDIDEKVYNDLKNGIVHTNVPLKTILALSNGTLLSDVLANIRGDIWNAGVNMTGEYQGVWTRFSDVETSFAKQMGER